MSCRPVIEERMFKLASEIATEGVKHIQREGKVFYPINPKGGINTIKDAYDLAKERATAINKEFNAGKYGRSAIIDNGYNNGVAIEIDIKEAIVDKFTLINDKVAEVKQAMEIQKEDAKREGLQYHDRYKFDEMLSVHSSNVTDIPDGYNFGAFLDEKIKVLEYLTHRRKVLSNMSNKTEADRRQIHYLRERGIKDKKDISNIEKLLAKDVSLLQEGETILGNVMRYFHNDLNTINEILKNPTIENLALAGKYIENIQNGVTKTLSEKGSFLEKEFKKMPEGFKEMFEKLKIHFNDVSDNLKIETERQSAKMLYEAREKEEGEPSLDEEAQIKELRDMLASAEGKDLGSISSHFDASFQFLPVDGDGKTAPTVQILVRKITDDAFAVKETIAIQDELLRLKPKLEKEKLLPPLKGFWNMLNPIMTKYDYDVFKRVTENGNSRLVSKYSSSWEAILTGTKRVLSEIRSDTFKDNKNETDRIAINNKRKGLFDRLAKEEVTFIDATRIEEFANDPEIVNSILRIESILGITDNGLLSSFTTEETGEYKDTIINTLMVGGRRESAEVEYDKIVEEQKEKFYNFELELDSQLAYYLDYNKVNNITELPQSALDQIQNFYFLNSPLSFQETYQTNNNALVPQTVNQATEYHQHTLNYVSFLPIKDSAFDQDFVSQIESNDTLYRTWELLAEALKFINENRKGARGKVGHIDSMIDVSKTHSLELASNASHFVKGWQGAIHILDATIKAIGLNATSKGSAELKGTIKSIDEAVREVAKPLYSRFKAMKIPLNYIIKPGEPIPDSVKAVLKDNIRLTPVTRDTTLKQYIENSIREDIYKSQDNGMIDSVVSQLAVVQLFKSKKEVETKLNFFLNLVRNAVKAEDISEKNKIVILIESFINTHLYGKRERGNTRVGRLRIGVSYSREDFIRKAMTKTAIKEMELIARNSPEGDFKEQIKQDIIGLEKTLKNIGTSTTVSSLQEFIFLKARIVAGLGYNVASQVMNSAIGNMAGRQNEGITWTRGNFSKAYSYDRFRKKQHYLTFSKKVNYNHDLTDSLINSLGVFQNSANDFVVNSTGQKLKDKFSPVYIIAETEKRIQRPQILALLGDVKIYRYDDNGEKIKDPSGNPITVPAFDVDNHDNPHPAFELVEGVFRLREEFNDKKGINKATWVTRSSKEYAELFGNSGKIPKVIAEINGDYRETSSIMMKKNMMGAILMAFKTWFVAYYLKRFGETKGIYTNLAKDGHFNDVAIGLGTKAALYTTLIGGANVVSPLVGLMGGLFLAGRSKILKSMEGDITMLQALNNTLQSVTFDKNFAMSALNMGYKAGFGIPVASGLKLAQKFTTTFVVGGKHIIPNSFIDKVAGVRQGKNESTESFEKNKIRMDFLIMEMANIMQMMVYKSMALLILAPDDEEDEKYKNTTLSEKFSEHKMTMLYYLIENMTSRFAADISLDVDAVALLNIGSIQTADDIEGIMNALAMTAFGQPTMKSGPNIGRNRLKIQLEKHFMPKGARDLFDSPVDTSSSGAAILSVFPTGGFASQITKDKTPGDLFGKWLGRDSAKEHFTKLWKEGRATLREELKERYKKEYPEEEASSIKKEVERQVNAMHPSIKNYFKPSGEPYEDAEYLLKRYEGEEEE